MAGDSSKLLILFTGSVIFTQGPQIRNVYAAKNLCICMDDLHGDLIWVPFLYQYKGDIMAVREKNESFLVNFFHMK